jgi:hypothetical protein
VARWLNILSRAKSVSLGYDLRHLRDWWNFLKASFMAVKRISAILAVGMMVWTVGCSGSTPKPPAPETTTTEATTPTTTPVEKPASTTDILKSKEPTTPAVPVAIEANSAAAAVTKTLQSLEQGNLAEAYDFLPPSYQADVDGLIQEFANRMDPEVWSRLIGTARQTIDVLKTKKELILDLDLFRNRPEVEPYRKSWDSSLEILSHLSKSDAAELATLKKVTARSLLPGKTSATPQQFDAIGLALGANLARQFAGVTVTPVRTDGAAEVVAIRGPTDEEPSEVVYVKHDGRWLPKSLVDHWDEGIKADRVWLEKLPARIKAVKPQILEALSQADEILDQLAAAGNREQFEQAAGPAILSLATAWPNLQLLARQAMTGESTLPSVTITINHQLSEAEAGKFTATVLKPLNEAGSDYTFLANDGRTFCRLQRIDDMIALQVTLATYFKVPAAAVRYDRDAATITIDLDR